MIYISWDTEQNILKLVILGHFLPFYRPSPPKKPQNQNLKNETFYTCVPKITIIWGTVPEIRSETYRTFCHFGPLFALLPFDGPKKSKFWKNEKNTWRYYHFTNVYHKWQSYDVWFLRYGVQQTELLVFWTIFSPFTPLTRRKI